MPRMSRVQSTFCQSALWRGFARRAVLPWALQGFRPEGDVLEIGAGSGAMAAELLATYSGIRLTATDFDDEMVAVAAARLAPFGDRATARQADATALTFPDASFDVVLSWVMLHHTIEWEKALAEAVRVLRPGGHLVGYDLLSTAPLRLLRARRPTGADHTCAEHQGATPPLRMMRATELRDVCRQLPLASADVRPRLGFLVRFILQTS